MADLPLDEIRKSIDEGEDQEMGVYVYRCNYRNFGDTSDRELKGKITLLR